jgi:hypothetical protein
MLNRAENAVVSEEEFGDEAAVSIILWLGRTCPPMLGECSDRQAARQRRL